MKLNFILFIFILLFFVSTKCKNDIYHHELTIRNNSSFTIIVSPSFNFPDTTIFCPIGAYLIQPGCEYTDIARDGWETFIGYSEYYQFFVFDAEIVNSTPCDTIKKYNKVLKRYQLNIDALNRMNWTITYP